MMKKILLLFCLLVAGIATAAGQTCFYKALYDVDRETEARSSASRRDVYITFTDKGCYISNAEGGRLDMAFYKFRYRSGDVLVYESWTSDYWGRDNWGLDRFSFSPDYRRMNYKAGFSSYITVYERGNPEDEEVPETLY